MHDFLHHNAGLATESHKLPAGEINRTRLLAELTRRGSGIYRFVARETLREIIRELDSIEELEAPNNSRVVDLLRNAKVDILIVGALRKTGQAVTVSYKAVSVEDGIVFAATDDQPKMFAYDLESGELIWETTLPAAAQATPMTYVSDGKQFVVITAGGEDMETGKPGDYVIAFSQP